MANLPSFEVLIRSPLGDIRVWIDDDGAQRTEMRCQFPSTPTAGEQARLIAAVAEQAANVARGMAGRTGAGVATSTAVGEWFATRVVREPGCRYPSLGLYEDFVAFCQARGTNPMSIRGFGDALSDRGVLHAGKDRYGRKLRGGVRLADAAAPTDAAPAPTPSATNLTSVGAAA